MSYSQGVLIHNFNEDRFGQDLQTLRRPASPPKLSVSHTVHHWKTPDPADKFEPAAAKGVDAHLLFGHAGDMREPRSALSATEFHTAHQYFMQDPRHVPHVGHLTADGYTTTKPSVAITSHLATAKKKSWGDLRQSHSLPANERFLTTHKLHFQGEPDKTNGIRIPRQYGEFTKLGDATNLTRSTALLRRAGSAALL
mmetsp:Transcript_78330/g.219569  ORF Transcript_78330/g.219569 Transcript_78330/m.219569 type:complete len:197 (+) Transcript_78330:115-705(+)